MKRCITIVIGFLMGCYICMGAPVVNYLLNADFAEVTESGMPTSWGTRHWGMWYGSFEI